MFLLSRDKAILWHNNKTNTPCTLYTRRFKGMVTSLGHMVKTMATCGYSKLYFDQTKQNKFCFQNRQIYSALRNFPNAYFSLMNMDYEYKCIRCYKTPKLHFTSRAITFLLHNHLYVSIYATSLFWIYLGTERTIDNVAIPLHIHWCK